MTTSSTLVVFILLFMSTASVNSLHSLPDGFFECLKANSMTSGAGDKVPPISEHVYTPDSSNFTTMLNNYVRNLRFAKPGTPKPLAIVAAAHPQHVQAVVRCSKGFEIQLRIRSGGHDYEGLSYVSHYPFVILDMFNLRLVDIDLKNETAWVGAGATLGELYYYIAEKSNVHAFPAGVCPGLGTGGHFSGGGYGNLMRKFGLSVDNIIDAQVVDAKGRLLDRSSMGEDLFWAIRGGGAASFGVVVAWKIKLVPVPKKVTVFKVEETVEDGATDLIVKWQDIAPKIDNDLFIRLTLSVVNASKATQKTIKAAFNGMFVGNSDRLLIVMNSSFPELGLAKNDSIEMKWIESVLYWFDMPAGTSTTVLLDRIPKFKVYLKRKSDYVQTPISRKDLESIFKTMMENEKISMAWNPYGGRMSEIGESETPFPHRAGNLFKIQYQATWLEGGDELEAENLNSTENVYEAMTPFVSKNPREAFLNYRDIDIGSNVKGTYEEGKVYGLKYFKKNFDRLVEVKTKADPDNFFRYEQSIPTLSSLMAGRRQGASYGQRV